MIEGSLEVKLPTVWTDEETEVGRAREEKRREDKTTQGKKKENDQRKEEKKKENGQRGEKKDWEERRSRCAKSRQGAKHWVFPMICGPGGSKSRLAKAAGAEPSGKMRDEKLYAAVARSTFRSQNVQNTSASEHFSELRCRKSARRCGAKHISKLRCWTRWSPRTRMLTRMLMVQMSKHMVMQWRTIPSCNSLFEQSCTCFPCYQSAVWSGKCRVWSVECEVRSVECKVGSVECVKCRMRSVECRVWSMECKV